MLFVSSPTLNSISPVVIHMLQFPPAPMDRSSRSSWKPTIELAPNCPRCASSNTKFCYYNNYSLSQPRYFCKACRRYWTKGGSLRNVPVGGGCRKNRRGKTARHPQMHYTRGSSEDPGSENRENATNEANGADIDMAAVFAKYLNQNSSSGRELDSEANLSSSSNLSSSLTPESVGTENDIAVLFESHQKQCDPITDPGMVSGEIPREEIIENFVGDELCGIDLQGLLGADDQVATQDQDVFWSDVTASSSVTWQRPPPVMQLQELDYSMPSNIEDCQLPVNSTMNLISDAWSWSFFDLPTLEVFSRP